MVYDHIKNIGMYKCLTSMIDLAMDYVAGVGPEVEISTHLLDLGVKAVVSGYKTRLTNKLGYDAYRRYIDVQLAVIGTELVSRKPLVQVTEAIPYDEASDAAQYADCPGIERGLARGSSSWSFRRMRTSRGWHSAVCAER